MAGMTSFSLLLSHFDDEDCDRLKIKEVALKLQKHVMESVKVFLYSE